MTDGTPARPKRKLLDDQEAHSIARKVPKAPMTPCASANWFAPADRAVSKIATPSAQSLSRATPVNAAVKPAQTPRTAPPAFSLPKEPGRSMLDSPFGRPVAGPSRLAPKDEEVKPSRIGGSLMSRAAAFVVSPPRRGDAFDSKPLLERSAPPAAALSSPTISASEQAAWGSPRKRGGRRKNGLHARAAEVLNRARTDHTLWTHAMTRADAEDASITFQVEELYGDLITRCRLLNDDAPPSASNEPTLSGTVVFSLAFHPKRSKPPEIDVGSRIDVWPPWNDIELIERSTGAANAQPRRALLCSRFRVAA